MAHIKLPEGFPGIVGPMAAYPDTERHLNGLAEALLRGPSSLTPAEREVIATRVSSGNECYFCTQSHAAAARHLLKEKAAVVDQVIGDSATGSSTAACSGVADGTLIDDRLRALLHIADKVRQDGRLVTDDDVARARAAGADDKAIHDTVLIAAAFCMYNRYVDGLATWTPRDPKMYDQVGARLARDGYLKPIRSL